MWQLLVCPLHSHPLTQSVPLCIILTAAGDAAQNHAVPDSHMYVELFRCCAASPETALLELANAARLRLRRHWSKLRSGRVEYATEECAALAWLLRLHLRAFLRCRLGLTNLRTCMAFRVKVIVPLACRHFKTVGSCGICHMRIVACSRGGYGPAVAVVHIVLSTRVGPRSEHVLLHGQHAIHCSR